MPNLVIFPVAGEEGNFRSSRGRVGIIFFSSEFVIFRDTTVGVTSSFFDIGILLVSDLLDFR